MVRLFDQAGLFLNRSVFDQALKVVVHSPWNFAQIAAALSRVP